MEVREPLFIAARRKIHGRASVCLIGHGVVAKIKR
jgi:hypothetical protein